MDTFTHGLSGALLAQTIGTARSVGLPVRQRVSAGFIAAAFPDIDYLVFWADPLVYLTLHQGPTHSLVLMPLWAGLVAAACPYLLRGAHGWRAFYPLCVLGISAHIGGDLITAYGTQIWAPFSQDRVTLPITYVIDPVFSGTLLIGLLVSFKWNARRSAVLALGILGSYLGLQYFLHTQALAIGHAYARGPALGETSVHAMAQPFSPFNWKIIVSQELDVYETHLRLTGPDGLACPGAWLFPSTAAAYVAPSAARWTRYPRFGTDDPRTAPLAREVWSQDGFAGFREFARFPALYRVDRGGAARCVWFTDLRYTLPEMLPPFRFGMCRRADADPWRLYRLRLFTEDERQAIPRRRLALRGIH
ncbi:MAG: metal-dependent hydrolase [Gammaproteobacteria bacterium]